MNYACSKYSLRSLSLYWSTQSTRFQSFMNLCEGFESPDNYLVFFSKPRAWQVDLQWSWQRLAWRIILLIINYLWISLVVGVNQFDFGAWRLWSLIPWSAKWKSSALSRGLAMPQCTHHHTSRKLQYLVPCPNNATATAAANANKVQQMNKCQGPTQLLSSARQVCGALHSVVHDFHILLSILLIILSLAQVSNMKSRGEKVNGALCVPEPASLRLVSPWQSFSYVLVNSLTNFSVPSHT